MRKNEREEKITQLIEALISFSLLLVLPSLSDVLRLSRIAKGHVH